MALLENARTILEKTTAIYSATIKDENGNPVALASIDAITLKLYAEGSSSYINSRNGQNIKNANNVTIHATSGLLTWEMTPADNVVVSTDLPADSREKHIALFEWTYNGSRAGKHETYFYIKQMEKVS